MDDADGFQRAAVGKLRDDGGIDVHADEADAGGGHVSHADGMEHRGEHEDHFGALEKAGVVSLRLKEIHLRVGQGAVIANGAGQRELDVVPDAFIENAAGERALGDGGGNAAGAADGINRAQVMAVAAVDGDAPLQVDAQGCSEEGLLDIMHGHGIPAEQRLHVTLANQPREVFARAGVDGDGTGDHHGAGAAGAEPMEFPGDLLHHEFHAAFAGNARAHKAEFFRGKRPAIPRFGQPPGAQAAGADDDLVIAPQVPDEFAMRGAFGGDHDHSIHPLAVHRRPSLTHSDLGGVDGGDMEILGRDAILNDGGELGVTFGGTDERGAQDEEVGGDGFQRFVSGGGNLNGRGGGALALAAPARNPKCGSFRRPR